jgi:ElaB/YqjD/DUF883 family membrane-anchored ribosome-binding protein
MPAVKNIKETLEAQIASCCDPAHIKAVVSDAVEEGLDTAGRAVKHGMQVAEKMVDEAEGAAKRHFWPTLGITFGVAFATGLLTGWLVTRRR